MRAYPGSEQGEESTPVRFRKVIKDAENEEGPYMRAAALLKGIAGANVFSDRNRSLSLVISVLFLWNNGLEVGAKDGKLLAQVLENHGLYSRSEIAEYLETGDIDDGRLP